MTIKPKAKKFRIRRNSSLSSAAATESGATSSAEATPDAAPTAAAAARSRRENPAKPATDKPRNAAGAIPAEDGFGSAPFPTAAASDAKPKGGADAGAAAEIEAIKAEGPTGRQLRMARRIAQKHGLAPESDFDAVRLLRAKGIDPFGKSAMLELVVPDKDGPASDGRNLPQTVPDDKAQPPKVYDEADRAREIYRIQRDIARRRRRAMSMLFARLTAFVFLPTVLVGVYFYNYATPLYATKSEFVIQQADSAGSGGLGGMFSGTGFATSQDSITVQSYLQSRDAMLRLDEDIGFKENFSGENIDFLRRLDPDATNEETYRLYAKMVKIGYDPTEGIIKLEVIAPDPETSASFSSALIAYAEEQVDNLTQRLREDQMKGSRESYQEAEQKMLDAQQRVLELQENLGIIDATSETSAIMSQIGNFETQLQEKKLQLQQLLDNARPNQARVDGVRGDISRLENLVSELRAQLTQTDSSNDSLARITGEMRLAELELETRTAMMQQALQQLETARIEANRQVRYLSIGVSPVAPDEPTYPRKFENTAVSLLIFSAIYLMMSLTASILREQVSA